MSHEQREQRLGTQCRLEVPRNQREKKTTNALLGGGDLNQDSACAATVTET